MLLLLSVSSVVASYDSLTDKELARVQKALIASKYYTALVAGSDSIKVTKTRLVQTLKISENIEKRTYQLEIDLTVNKKIFKKVATVSIDISVVKSKKIKWYYVAIPIISFLGGCLVAK